MALSELEITMQEALQDFGLTVLPKEMKRDGSMELLEGIALVTKTSGIRGYVKVVGDGEGGITVKKDYGRALMIVSIDTLFPVKTLDSKRFRPDLRSDKQILQFLAKNDYSESEISALLSKKGKTAQTIESDRNIIKNYINKTAAKIAKNMLKEDERIKDMRTYASRIKNGKEDYR